MANGPVDSARTVTPCARRQGRRGVGDPTDGPGTRLKLQRSCERSRLEKQFLIDAYECLVAIIDQDGLRDSAEHRSATSEAPREGLATRGTRPG
jgi:hypothetical protein